MKSLALKKYGSALALGLCLAMTVQLSAFAAEALAAGYNKKYAEVNREKFAGPGMFGSVSSPELSNAGNVQEFEGGEMRFLSNKGSESQQLSAVLKSSDGKIVVVDGGVAADTEHLIQNIKELGGYVDAWLITHPQQDHIGALVEILNNRSAEIDIRNIYYSFHELEWYREVDAEESGIVYVLADALSRYPQDRVHGNIKRDDVITLSDKISIRVMNDPVKVVDAYAVNNSSIMYDVTMNGKRIIFLGDMGPEAGRQLMVAGVIDNVTADYVQISHHGQNGVDEEFYKKLNPKNCIWPTPKWLYDVQVGNPFGFKTYETREWIDKLNTEHNYCTKDGDVVIY